MATSGEQPALNYRFHHPLYLHYFDRELGASVNFTPDANLIRDVTSCLLIASPAPLYCGLSPVWETSFGLAGVAQFVAQVERAGHLTLLSNHPTQAAFIAARREAYQHDQPRYPMYFEDDPGPLAGLKPTADKSGSATETLRTGLLTWADDPPAGDLASLTDESHRDRMLKAVSVALNKRDQKAVTFAMFRPRLRSLQTNPIVAGVLQRQISASYTRHYKGVENGDIATGIRGLSAYDSVATTYPFYDFPLLRTLLGALRLNSLTNSPVLWEEFLAIRGDEIHLLFADHVRVFMAGLCAEAGLPLPPLAVGQQRESLRQAALRLLNGSESILPPGQTACDVLLAAAARLRKITASGLASRPFLEAAHVWNHAIRSINVEGSSIPVGEGNGGGVAPGARGPHSPTPDPGGGWDGGRLRSLRETLTSQFPTKGDVAILVSDYLGENLDVIVSGSNLDAMVFELLRWANIDPNGRLNQLVRGAAKERPNCTILQTLVAQLPGERAG